METNQFSIRPLNKYVLDVWSMIGTVAALVSRMDLSSMELILWWGPLRKKSNTNEPNPNGRRAAKKRNPVQ